MCGATDYEFIPMGICNKMKTSTDCPFNVSERVCLDCPFVVEIEEESLYNKEELNDEFDHQY